MIEELSHEPIEESTGRVNKRFNQLEFSLVFISSILLGIWATKDTIALRNILLVLGTVLSLIYITLEFRLHHLASELTLKTCIPLILIGLMFVWDILHYFLESLIGISRPLVGSWRVIRGSRVTAPNKPACWQKSAP
jgi:hypothetical protein